MSTSYKSTASPPTEAVPPLENGDRLTRAEFERRYDAMPHLKKAELLEGVVYMGSPVYHETHGRPHFQVIGWLSRYIDATPGLDAGDNSSLRLDEENVPQPDALLSVLPEYGGTARVDEDHYLSGAPELVVEVASSSVSYDLHVKLHVYRRHGVKEYVVWRIRDRAIDWFVLRGDRYERMPPGTDGRYRSEIFPGLWLDPEAMVRADRPTVARVVAEGIASPEHAAFVAALARAARPPG